MTRMLNKLTSTIATLKKLPKYLIVIIDKDIILDTDVFDPQAPIIIEEMTRWFIRQIDVILRRKKVDFLNKKPGALTGLATMTIYIRMLRRAGTFNDQSRIYGTLQLRSKFNNTLNDTIAKLDQCILTVNSCNTYEDFNHHGNLSPKGKSKFWWEIDDLLERFEKNKIKLLPTPKNPQHQHGR